MIRIDARHNHHLPLVKGVGKGACNEPEEEHRQAPEEGDHRELRFFAGELVDEVALGYVLNPAAGETDKSPDPEQPEVGVPHHAAYFGLQHELSPVAVATWRRFGTHFLSMSK